LVELRKGVLLAVGGHHPENKTIDSCEAYNVNVDEWESIDSLIDKRSDHTAFVFDCNIVYVYGGIDDSKEYNINTFEYIDFDEDEDLADARWKPIKLQSHEIVGVPCYGITNLVLNDDDVMIFGLEDDFQITTKNAIIFNRRTSKLRNAPFGLLESDNFHRDLHVFYMKKHYFLSVSGNLHMFDGEKWEIYHLFESPKD